MSEYQSLQILDELGFPLNPNKILFSSFDNTLIYSFGTNIICYSLNNNTKTFLQLSTSNIIIALKCIDIKNKILLAIDNNKSPLIYIWNLNNMQNIFNQEILIKDNYGFDFPISNIFIETIKKNYYLIFISSLNSDDFILYILYLSNDKYYLEPFCSQINQITNDTKNNNNEKSQNNIIGFKYFLNTETFIIIYKSLIEFYEININNRNITLRKKIIFNFNIMPHSFSLSYDHNLFGFITSEGNCLIYDINYVKKARIKPYNEDIFTVCFFNQGSLFLGTNNGQIFVYQIKNDNSLKYYINYNKIYLFKKEFQINFNKNLYNKNIDEKNDMDNEGPSIDFLECNEKNDKLFIKMGDNSILLCPISFIIDNNNGYVNEKIKGNTPVLYAYNHSKEITDIDFFPLSNNEIIDYSILNNQMQTVFYTCAKDNLIIKYYINHEDNKLYNQYYDLYNIFLENNLRINNSRESSKEFWNYFTIIKFHPIQKNYLYIGDNKGCLYILDTNKNNIIYKQYIGETYSIDSLSFNNQGNTLSIGYETGMHIIYIINIANNTQLKFEKYLVLNNHFHSPEAIKMRQKNNHILSYSYFFTKNKNKFDENKIIYMKNNNNIECCLIANNKNNHREILSKINFVHKILDMKMHIGENYIIILDDNLQINIYDLINNNITGIIELSGQLKYAYNMDIDISGLYLVLLCQLKYNKNEKSDIILFELGTGNVYTFITGMSTLIKIKFDNSGKYLITIGTEGEVSLLGLDENVITSIQNVIKQMTNNQNFLDEYEIILDDNKKENNMFNNNTKFFNNNYMGKKLYKEIISKTENNYTPDLNKNNDNYNKNNNFISNTNYNYSRNNDKTNLFKNNNNNNNYPSFNEYKSNNTKMNTENDVIKNSSYGTFNLRTKNSINGMNNGYNKISNYVNYTNSFKGINRYNNTSIKYNKIPQLSYISIVKNTFNKNDNNNSIGISIRDKINQNLKKEIQRKNIT